MINKEYSNIIKNLLDNHTVIAKKCITAYNGTFYPIDLLALSVINRSYNLLDGFIDLIEKKNIIAAAPLIRMQLDNVLRFSATFYVEKPHDFALKVLEGTPIRKIKSSENELMTDRYLVEKLVIQENGEWIKKVYNNTSGYIHFSEKHIFSTFKINETDDVKTVKASIGMIGESVEESLIHECIKCFIDCTEMLMKYVEGWIFTKDNPEAVQKMKQEIIKLQK